MRYFLICVAAFMLLAAPAFAADDDLDVIVTVTIGDLYDYSFYAPDATFTPDADDITAGFMVKEDAFTGDVSTNLEWDLNASIPEFVDWSTLDILLARTDGISDPDDYVWITVLSTSTDITTGGPGTEAPTLDMMLDGLAWGTSLPGSDSQTLTFTFTTN